jgi:hypothetical protein
MYALLEVEAQLIIDVRVDVLAEETQIPTPAWLARHDLFSAKSSDRIDTRRSPSWQHCCTQTNGKQQHRRAAQ